MQLQHRGRPDSHIRMYPKEEVHILSHYKTKPIQRAKISCFPSYPLARPIEMISSKNDLDDSQDKD